jgi:anaerobic ribonucleoside-triphosphate reductase
MTANMSIVKIGTFNYLISYSHTIARYECMMGNYVEINKQYYKYSNTTSKHLHKFLGISGKEIEKKIKTGEFKLVEGL